MNAAEPPSRFPRGGVARLTATSGRIVTWQARAVVESPEAVARHAFWPFVRYAKQVRRFDHRTGTASFKLRSVQYPAHLDANIFAHYAERLAAPYEARLAALGLTAQVTAYRPLGRSNVDFAAEAFAWVRDHAPCSVYCFDVSSFFDNLDHALLKAAWCGLLGEEMLPADHFAVYKAMTRYAWVQREQLPAKLTEGERQTKRYCTVAAFRRLRENGQLRVRRNREDRGIPQGVQLSAVLSNLYMLEFDRRVAPEIEGMGGFYRRYSDDILIAVPADAEVGFGAETFLEQALAERRLPLNVAKTTRHRVETDAGAPRVTPPVTYLGLAYDGERILLRGATLARFHRRMTHAVARAPSRGGLRRPPSAAAGETAQALHPRRAPQLRRLCSAHRGRASRARVREPAGGTPPIAPLSGSTRATPQRGRAEGRRDTVAGSGPCRSRREATKSDFARGQEPVCAIRARRGADILIGLAWQAR